MLHRANPVGTAFTVVAEKFFTVTPVPTRIERLIEAASTVVHVDLEHSVNDPRVKSALLNPDVKERYHSLIALTPTLTKVDDAMQKSIIYLIVLSAQILPNRTPQHPTRPYRTTLLNNVSTCK